MEKNISYSQFQSIKRVAQACDPLRTKRDKLMEKINLLTEEYESLSTQISSFEAGIKTLVGLSVEDIVKKVVEPGIDANGQPKKTTKYLPTDIVSYDENKKQFVITLPDPEVSSEYAEEAPCENPVEHTPNSNTETTSIFE